MQRNNRKSNENYSLNSQQSIFANQNPKLFLPPAATSRSTLTPTTNAPSAVTQTPATLSKHEGTNLSDFSALEKILEELEIPKKELIEIAHYLVADPRSNNVYALIRVTPQFLNSKIENFWINVGGLKVELVNNTPFQLAYGAGDVEMCEMLKAELVRLMGEESAIAEIQRQIEEKKFNTVDQVKESFVNSFITKELATIIKAISKEQFNHRDVNGKLTLSEETYKAIQRFRKIMLLPYVIHEGMHFRSKTLLQTIDAYAQAAAEWNYDLNKCALFEDGVLSAVLSCVPSNDAQRFAQGLLYIHKNEPLRRNLNLRDRGQDSIYIRLKSLSSTFASLQGSCVDIIVGGPMLRPCLTKAFIINCQRLLHEFYAAKELGLQNLCTRANTNKLRP